MQTKLITSNLVSKAKEYAISCHEGTNHKYNNEPYSVHLKMVYDYAIKYINLVAESNQKIVLSACWCHDLIEDTRQSYNDVENNTSIEVADIVYALTNEKGKNRKERANDKYYEGIMYTPFATFVKLCDRLANVKYSKEHNSDMFKVYKKEHYDFEDKLWKDRYKEMFDELREMLGL